MNAAVAPPGCSHRSPRAESALGSLPRSPSPREQPPIASSRAEGQSVRCCWCHEEFSVLGLNPCAGTNPTSQLAPWHRAGDVEALREIAAKLPEAVVGG